MGKLKQSTITMVIIMSAVAVYYLSSSSIKASIFDKVSFEEFYDPGKYYEKKMYEAIFNKAKKKKQTDYEKDRKHLHDMVKGMVDEIMDNRLKEPPTRSLPPQASMENK